MHIQIVILVQIYQSMRIRSLFIARKGKVLLYDVIEGLLTQPQLKSHTYCGTWWRSPHSGLATSRWAQCNLRRLKRPKSTRIDTRGWFWSAWGEEGECLILPSCGFPVWYGMVLITYIHFGNKTIKLTKCRFAHVAICWADSITVRSGTLSGRSPLTIVWYGMVWYDIIWYIY